MAQWVLASDGRPFSDRDAASIKRDLLSAELGAAVKLDVVAHPAGGYAVACSRPTTIPNEEASGLDISASWLDERAARETRGSATSTPPRSFPRASARQGAGASSPASNTQRATPRPYPDVFRMSPAARAFLGQHVLALLGAYFLFRPHDLFLLVGFGIPQNRELAALALGAVMLASVVLALVSVSRFLWAYTANTYVVDRTGVEQVQWYFERGRLRRRAPRVNFAHLRTADVDQTVMQMLLDVGTLRLASGATDTYELDLRHVGSPRRLQAEFQRRLREATAPASAAQRHTDL